MSTSSSEADDDRGDVTLLQPIGALQASWSGVPVSHHGAPPSPSVSINLHQSVVGKGRSSRMLSQRSLPFDGEIDGQVSGQNGALPWPRCLPNRTPSATLGRMRTALIALTLLGLVASCGKHKHQKEPAGEMPTKTVVHDAVPLTMSDGQLNLPIPLHFAGAGSTELADDCVPMLAKVKLWLDQKRDITLLRVEVHSDDDGDPGASQALSEARALAVCKQLVGLGADCKRVLPVGFGGSKPLADNGTADGKAKNRRVEVRPAAMRGKPLGGMPVDGGGRVAGNPCAK